MRRNLKAARKAAGLTQQQVADRLGISDRHYRSIETGSVLGAIAIWDALEDLFNVNQRMLRVEFPADEIIKADAEEVSKSDQV